VPVSVTFDMTQNCDLLKKFHQEIASTYSGWLNDDGSESDGWKALVAHVVGQPLQDSLNGVAQNYIWQDIWNNEKVRNEFREQIDKTLPTASKARTNGQEYFFNFQVTVLKPTPVNPGLKAAIEEQQRLVQVAQGIQAQGVAQANADKAKADAEVSAAEAQTRAAAQKALAQKAEIDGYGSVDAYLRELAIKQGLNPFQPQLVPQQTQGR
jgi:pyruvate-formate lyase